MFPQLAHSNVLPSGFTSFEEFAQEIVKFLREFSFLYNYFIYGESARRTPLADALNPMDFGVEELPVIDEEKGIHFLMRNHLERRIPLEWRTFLCKLDLEALSKIPSGCCDAKNWPASLCNFVEQASRLSFANVFENEPIAHEQFASKQVEEKILLRRMKPKKRHEVAILGKTVLQYAEDTKCETVVDIGAGQGYLSQYIFFRNQMETGKSIAMNIIGIDGDKLQTMGAKSLCSKQGFDIERCMRKYYPDHKRLELGVDSEQQDSSGLHNITAHLSLSINHSQFLQLLEPFITKKAEKQRILLIGLHTCGDLAPTMIKLFLNTDAVALINAGCCYHRMSEHKDYLLQKCATPDHCGYPMSSLLYHTKLPLSSGKHLAAGYSPNNANLEPLKFNYRMQSYRTALEQLLYEMVPTEEFESHHCGPCPDSHSTCFSKYARYLLPKMLKKPSKYKCQVYKQQLEDKVNQLLGTAQEELEQQLETFYRRFDPVSQEDGNYIPGVAIYATLRLVLCPVIESLVLTDRLLYMREQKQVKSANLVRLFDPRISPRGIVLVASKEQ